MRREPEAAVRRRTLRFIRGKLELDIRHYRKREATLMKGKG